MIMEKTGKTIKGIVISAVTAWIFMIAAAAVSAFLVYKGILTEKAMGVTVNITYFVSCFIAVFFSRRNFESRSFFKGALAGILFFATLLIVSYAFGSGRGMSNALTAFILCFMGGMFAGMIA